MRFNQLLCLVIATFAAAGSSFAQTNDVRYLSLDDCVQLAIQHNLDVQIQRFDPQLSRFNLEGLSSTYDPTLTLSGQHSFTVQPGGLDQQQRPFGSTISDGNSFSAGLSGSLPTGTKYRLSSSFNERYGGTVNITNGLLGSRFDNSQGSVTFGEISQDLLKDFWIDATRFNVSVSKNRLQYSELAVKNRLMQVLNSVEQAYYDLIFAYEDVKVQEKALELARQLLAENKKKVEVGALAPLDEKQTEAQAAASESDLISAQGRLADRIITLKNLITDDYSAWYRIQIVPSEKLVVIPEQFDIYESWGKGLKQRPDYLQIKLDLDRSRLQLKYDYNQLFPTLQLFGDYGFASSGKEFSDALSGIREGNAPNYIYGARLIAPLANIKARTDYKISKLQIEQARLVEKRLEQTVMTQIDTDLRSIRTSLEKISSTRQQRIYSEAALEAEQKKLENGKSTPFVVLQLQKDLTIARSTEIRALADYNKSLAQHAYDEGSTFERRKVNYNVR